MGLFSKKTKIDFDNIISVVILEQTQLYKGKSNWGVSFGSDFGDGRVIAMDGSVPAGAEIKFSVTYKDGRKDIVTAMSGTEECTKLLQIAIDPPSVMPSVVETTSEKYVPVQLQKNQLPNGRYIVGEEIPVGTYDFTWVFGNGSIHIFKDISDTKTLGASKYFQWIGDKHDYEFRQCLNVNCENGNVIVLDGNIVVEISRSKKVEIDL